MGELLHKSIEYLAANKPETLKSRKATQAFLMQICWNAVKKYKWKKDWDRYLSLIKVLMEEYCVSEAVPEL